MDETKPRKFRLVSVLNIAAGVTIGPLKNVLEIINSMHGQTVHSTRIPEAMELCRKKICREYPGLDVLLGPQIEQMKGIVPPGSKEDMASIFLRHWLSAMTNIYGEEILLFPLPYKLDLANPRT